MISPDARQYSPLSGGKSTYRSVQFSRASSDVGLRRGDWVSVTPDDYGNPVHGAILAWTADEIVIRHEDPSVGKVNVHFPRVGFDVAPAPRLAA
jgi:hypothetical protein